VSAREFALLAALLERPGTALSKGQLEERLYGWGEEVESNTVEVHVHNLRKKLGAETIRTIPRRGLSGCQGMTSIRRTLLVWLLLGLVAVAVLASVATYFDTRREIGELFDLQLKQLAYSTRIDDLLRGRQPSIAGPGADRATGVSEIVTQIWDRDGVLVYYSRPGTGLPVPATEGYSNVIRDGHGVARVHARRRAARVAGRPRAGRAARDRRAIGIAYAAAAGCADPVPGRAHLVRSRPWPAPARKRCRAQWPSASPTPWRRSPETGLPEELRPLAGSLNALLARLDDALNAQRRFTADAAHELRTPLAALKLQVELVERAPDDGARGAALAELEEGVDRASHLVEQLLAMARLEPEALARNFGDCDLVAIAKDVIVSRATLAADRKIDLGLARSATVRARGDAASLSMLLANLLDNALRYTPEGGRIDVAIDDDAGHAILSVADTGPGIPASERERVFDRFHPRCSGGSGSKRKRARAFHRQAHRRRPWRNRRAGQRRRRAGTGRARLLSLGE
jgi:two-component system OmpR family sensor kinase